MREEALGRGELSGAESALAWHHAVPPLETYLGELEREADTVDLQHVVRAGYDAAQRGKLLERQQKDLEEEGLDGYCWTRYRDLERRKEFWHKLPYNPAEGAEPRITRRETFLAHAHGVILDAALVDETRGSFTLAQRQLESHLAIRPDNARAYYLIGEICRQRGLPDDRKARLLYECDRPASVIPGASSGLRLLYYKESEKARARSSLAAYLIDAPDAPDKAYFQRYLSTGNWEDHAMRKLFILCLLCISACATMNQAALYEA